MATYSPGDAVSEGGEDGHTLIKFDVSPNSSETRVPSGFNEWRGRFEARLSKPAQDGEANAELVGELEDMFGTNASIVSGQTSSKKTVRVEKSREEVLKILKDSV
ncbi:MAG: DUF167 family protein [Halobacteria archaeon]|nr:DUF167 family protein [Halobacteria archaeon]